MTIIEMQVLTVVRSCLPEIAKALQRIADALEKKDNGKEENNDNH